MERDQRSALSLQKVVTEAIKVGTSLPYLASRYGLPLERLEKYRSAWEAKQVQRAEAK